MRLHFVRIVAIIIAIVALFLVGQIYNTKPPAPHWQANVERELSSPSASPSPSASQRPAPSPPGSPENATSISVIQNTNNSSSSTVDSSRTSPTSRPQGNSTAPSTPPSSSSSPPSCSESLVSFMIMFGYVPEYFENSLYNKILMFGSDKVTIFHDVYKQDYFTFYNLEFVRVDFSALIAAEGYSSMRNKPDDKVRVSDIVRFLLCRRNCFYFDLDVFFFKKIDFDFLAYEPISKKSLNNCLYRLSCENNRFLDSLRGYLRSQKDTGLTQTFNVMSRLWDEFYPNFGTATVLDIPIHNARAPPEKKPDLVKDLKFFAQYRYFWHAYDKTDYPLIMETHRKLFPKSYNDTILTELTAFLKKKSMGQ